MQELHNIKDIEIHSEEVNDILSRPPAWILRWGITLFFFIVALLIFGSIFFKYPNVLTVPVHISDLVLTLVPQEMGGIRGTLYIPQQGAGKVKPGQQVNIKLDHYPYMEFGMVQAIITHVSSIPVDMGGSMMIMADVYFPKGLITNYNLSIESGAEMNGIADIISEEISLFVRLFNPIKSIFKK